MITSELKKMNFTCRFSILLLLPLFTLCSCASLPPNTDAQKSFAQQGTEDTHFGKISHTLRSDTSGDSGFILLSNGVDAFTARMALATYAEKSIDAQYYMIHNDSTGLLFTEYLLNAADRGVRVRLLIDDIDLEARDESIIAIASHPHIDVRVFNPFSRSFRRSVQFITRFGEVTRRMHNKSFTIDNQISIVGGRNIGNEYFNADPNFAFADLDILAVGPVVKQVSCSFDEYWNYSLAYPITTLRPDLINDELYQEKLVVLNQKLSSEPVAKYKQKLFNSELFKNIHKNNALFRMGKATVLSDSPAKLANYDMDMSLTLTSQLKNYFTDLEGELLIFSPYFVPGVAGTKFLADLSKQGVNVRILTNSLASNDVSIVHAGYAKYRTTLLRAGVELYEMNNIISEEEREELKGAPGSSKASLHAKSFVFDRKDIFVGSFNLDPRSIRENTEIGIVVRSEELAEKMAAGFDRMVENVVFRLELVTDDDGIERILWHGRENGQSKIWRTDPRTSTLQRFTVFLMGLLPIESQL